MEHTDRQTDTHTDPLLELLVGAKNTQSKKVINYTAFIFSSLTLNIFGGCGWVVAQGNDYDLTIGLTPG